MESRQQLRSYDVALYMVWKKKKKDMEISDSFVLSTDKFI